MRCGHPVLDTAAALGFLVLALASSQEDTLSLVQHTTVVGQSQALLPPAPPSRPRPPSERPALERDSSRPRPRPSGDQPGPHPRAKAHPTRLLANVGGRKSDGNCSAEERGQMLRTLRAISEGKSISDSFCHTVVDGDLCFRDTMWAMTEGFAAHPGLYVGLNKRSTFEEFQMYLYKIGHAHCPKPCLSGAGERSAGQIASARSREMPAAGAKAEAVFASMPKSCTFNMTHSYGVNFAQFETCLQTLLHLSSPCSACAAEFLRSFLGEDIFHMHDVCLGRCRPMASACQFGPDSGSSVEALSGDCLDKAADCMDCVKPSVRKFLKCSGYSNTEEVQSAVTVLIQDFRSHSIVYPGHLKSVIQLALKGGF